MTETLPKRIVIVGLGLMGGSLARALARLPARADRPDVVACEDSDEAVAAALRAGVVSARVASVEQADAEMAVLALPVHGIIETLQRDAAALRTVPVVTDVCSVKGAVEDAARAVGLEDRFVGSHPLCGDHRSGFAASRAGLYDGATVYVTPGAASGPAAAVRALWRAAGALPRDITAAGHDELLARTSHLPQTAASAIAATLDRLGARAADMGPGGADTTRVAASSPELWTDVLLHNRAALLPALEELEAVLRETREALEAGDADRLSGVLQRARDWRSTRS